MSTPNNPPPFAFVGPLPPSKSLLIRQLLLKLYEPRIELPILSQCLDVVAMQAACLALKARETPRIVDCGEAGLVLRLCLGYAARQGGDHLLTGSPRLIERPHETLLSVLRTLGAEVELAQVPNREGPALRVKSAGWKEVSTPLPLAFGLSSQFASSLILNAWRLPFALRLEVGEAPISAGYLEMSIDVARRFGMDIQHESPAVILIPPHQQITPAPEAAEADVSSAFAVAAVAAVAGTAQITNFPRHSLQPDLAFISILSQMGVPIALAADALHVSRGERLRPIDVNVGGCPDLVPVLAVLCALADGKSRLYGAPHLRGKESDRVATTAALLAALGRACTPSAAGDGLEIFGKPLAAADRARPCAFDAGSDHRLVMAAGVAARAGFPLAIRGLAAVRKSFPEFLDLAGIASHPDRPDWATS